jgi:hypothetical protein
MVEDLKPQFRTSQPGDFDKLDQIEIKNRSFSDRLLLDAFGTPPFIQTNNSITISNPAGEILGLAYIKKISPSRIHIEYLYVRHDKRGLGIGTLFINYLKGLHCKSITASAFTGKSEAFFYKHRFKGAPGSLLKLIKSKKDGS